MSNETRMSKRVSRREFIRGLAALGGGAVLAACAPQVETVVETVEETGVVKETVVVEGETNYAFRNTIKRDFIRPAESL